MRSLTVWSTSELPWRAGATALLGFAAVLGIARVRDQRSVVRTVIVLLALYVCIPWGLRERVFYMSNRVFLLLQLFLAVVAQPPRWLRSAWVLGGLAVVTSAILLVIEQRSAASESAVLTDISLVGASIPRGQTLAYLSFRHDPTGAKPLQFGWGLLTVQRDVVTDELFADGLTTDWGGVGYRPLKYSRRLPPAESEPYDALRATLRGYDHVLLVQPSTELVDRLRADAVVEGHSGVVWLLRSPDGLR